MEGSGEELVSKAAKSPPVKAAARPASPTLDIAAEMRSLSDPTSITLQDKQPDFEAKRLKQNLRKMKITILVQNKKLKDSTNVLVNAFDRSRLKIKT